MGKLLDKANQSGTPKPKPVAQPREPSPKKSSGTPNNAKLMEALRILGMTEGLFLQLLGENIHEYMKDPKSVEFMGWQKFNPKGNHGSQGRTMIQILELIQNFNK